ncbi:sterol desaturase-related protein [Magnetococcus marinus MC-1]|uniref:Sterol desaturase-related protein n=1 Tax=Magnetococcus marinus (strain ATCC BAA-1437 / JCM 17883 / MC-1) TaxID=156889 RepID=A0L6C6_MAGMM|nr:sterol desaturase family protein [Magnetococcus marinus]ABK43519.1 sterol desaturase-related protein [Magnetococcus marinus MC-1]
MDSWLLQQEPTLRVVAFFSIFLLIAVWEWWRPRRVPRHPRMQRWPANLGLVLINTLLVRLLFPMAAVVWAAQVQQQGWGLLQMWSLPSLWALLLGVVLLDGVIYLQHVLVHALPLLWRLHQVHHADPDYDVTTGARFHPIEILLSMGIKFAAILCLAPPPAAVLLFEVILNGMAMFNHGNITLPLGLDRLLRWLVVTPDMHRVHHSTLPSEANSNFGFNLSLWDRLFGTYTAQPKRGHVAMEIGITTHQGPHTRSLLGMLRLPWQTAQDRYALTRRWSDPDA